ncbi:MAG: tRNA (adenosine(37)-N6)-dimethylallyltransferase MiaA, partial [Bacilli bacterium]|nr:tRNA (adenosine(37)-N6)-dimethylallyltransferase MiaA [Bacilli bacterium]
MKKFQTLAVKTINKLLKEKKLPIVIGGSNLYVDALIKNYDLSNGGRSNEFEELTNEQLYKELYSLSKNDALKIGQTNRKRLVRALQIIKHK